jgi:uncharacterized protein YggE
MLRSLWMCSLVLAIAGVAVGQESRKIEVRATGEVTVAADELTLPIEINTGSEDFAALKQRNDLLLSQLFELLATHKIDRPKIESTTGTFDFSPDDPYRNYGQKAQVQQSFKQPNANANANANPNPNASDPFGDPKLPGAEKSVRIPMHLSRRVTLKFTNLSQATELLAKLTALDPVKKSRELRLSPLQARVKDSEKHLAQARKAAVQNALEKAQLLAEASNLKLGPALSIVDETAAGDPRSVYFPPAFGPDPFGQVDPGQRLEPQASGSTFVVYQAEKTPADLPPGQIQFSVMVRVVYETTLAR